MNVVTGALSVYILLMQTALHILALVAELKQEVIDGRIVATEFYKKERAAYLLIRAATSRLALGFIYHPHGSGVFLAPASKVKVDTREKPWPVFKLENACITAVEQLGLDRIFTLTLDADRGPYRLVVEALGPNGNLWLLDCGGGVLATLRNRKFTKGEAYRPALLSDRLNPFSLSAEELTERLSRTSMTSVMSYVNKDLVGFNRTMAKECVVRAGLDFAAPADLTPADAERLVQAIHDLSRRFSQPSTAYLYELSSGPETYPFKLSLAEEAPKKCKTLSLGVLALTGMRRQQVGLADERKSVTDAVARHVRKLSRRKEKIERDLASAADYERYKRIGELIKINYAKITRGTAELEVDDVFVVTHPKIIVRLDPALSAAENAAAYFRKYRKGREGLELLRRRLEVTEGERLLWEEISSALGRDYESASGRYEEELTGLLPKEGVKREAAERLPYREYSLTTGVRVYVGRGGADNDRTTFEFAKPYELWFHTQQCPGSHVIIKYPNKRFEPSRREIEEAAAIAAWHSKAKNDSLVPVIYTDRRYVRKPRKAKPGLVTVEREKSVMVEPKEPK